MLVLSRKLNESIVINGNIIVTVVAFRDDKVRLGITAPDDVIIDREEIHLLRQRDQQQGENSPP